MTTFDLTLQIIGTVFIVWNVRWAWVRLWRTRANDEKALRSACLNLVFWSAAGGLAFGYWIDFLPGGSR